MFEKFKVKFEDYTTKRKIKNMQYYHSNLPGLIGVHKELRKYIPILQEFCKLKNKMIFSPDVIESYEVEFSLLMLCRNQDFFEGILFSLWNNNVHSIFPLMRALLDDLFLLKYVDKNPEYIIQFMKTEKEIDRTKKSHFLRNQSKDMVFRDYFKWLSDRTHPNPVSLKYHKLKQISMNGKEINDGESAIIVSSTCTQFYIQSVEYLIKIIQEELTVIQKIYKRNIKN